MTREEAIKGFEDMKKGLYPFYPDEYFDMAIKALDQEPMVEIDLYSVIKQKYIEREVIDKIFCIVHPLSIMSTPELEHKAIMQITEMLEPLCLPETEET